MGEPCDPNLTRRSFLKKTTAALGLAALAPRRLFAESKIKLKSRAPSVLVDLTRCISCRACSRACQSSNELSGAPSPLAPLDVETPAYNKWSVVNTSLIETEKNGPLQRSVKRQCMHCIDPACVSVCPVGALESSDLGSVIYRADRCIGCRYCMMACPFDVPKFQWDSGLKPVIGKCHFCTREKLIKGQAPACVDSCPTGALRFGTRQDMLFEARARLHSAPDKYVNHVYGENEVGGTSWLYISDVPFDKLGFPSELPNYPLPSLTWEVISRLPLVVAGLASLFGVLGVTLSKPIDHKPKKDEKS
jgi:formate dehydrogenase iron-sulfur subunit